ncbi:MAG: ABC transporter permease [Proteobacteria bacterium]|nr:ABC transporter permease [Pseudomonadota bacterium]
MVFIRIWALFVARNKEFLRDRSSLGWSILFPFLVIAGFSLMFTENSRGMYTVGILGKTMSNDPGIEDQLQRFQKTRFLVLVPFDDFDTAIDKLKHHGLDMILSPESGEYWISESSPSSYIVEKMLLSNPGEPGKGFAKRVIKGREVPYVEWLFPGILGMNMMFAGLFGVGFVVVRYRKNGMLKRLSATPIRAHEYLVSQVLSRVFTMLLTTAVVYGGCSFLYHFTCRGSYLLLLLIFFLGAISMVAMGLLVAARLSSEELASGLLNMIAWPMMFLSGVWFSLEGSKPWVKTLAQAFPLTHLIEGARQIMNDGAGFWDIRIHLLVLLIMSLVFLALGSLFFEWKKH